MSNLRNKHAFVRQTFCEENFKLPGHDSKWLDVVCIAQMSKGRIARIELSDVGYADHYAQLFVKIIHPENGTIDSKTFYFSDWLDTRDDDRTDHPNQRPYVWANNGEFKWYIALPSKTALKRLMAAIDGYIKAFEV
jgi:hypothetical protein